MQSKAHPTYKTKYRVANWAAYNQALVRRGDVTVWLSSDAIAAWTPRRSGRRGGQRRYSDLAIETALTLRFLYHLPLRQAEGFLHALFEHSVCLRMESTDDGSIFAEVRKHHHSEIDRAIGVLLNERARKFRPLEIIPCGSVSIHVRFEERRRRQNTKGHVTW